MDFFKMLHQLGIKLHEMFARASTCEPLAHRAFSVASSLQAMLLV